jgi:hypothetical protein
MVVGRSQAELWARRGPALGGHAVPPDQLRALQLRARGYSDAQIAPLVEQSPDGVAALLALAVAALGVPDIAGAIREARRRGLIA